LPGDDLHMRSLAVSGRSCRGSLHTYNRPTAAPGQTQPGFWTQHGLSGTGLGCALLWDLQVRPWRSIWRGTVGTLLLDGERTVNPARICCCQRPGLSYSLFSVRGGPYISSGRYRPVISGGQKNLAGIAGVFGTRPRTVPPSLYRVWNDQTELSMQLHRGSPSPQIMPPSISLWVELIPWSGRTPRSLLPYSILGPTTPP